MLEQYPRIGKMANFFESTALGIGGKPKEVYWGDVTNFKGNQACIDFYWEHRRQRGVFDNHFFRVFHIYWKKSADWVPEYLNIC